VFKRIDHIELVTDQPERAVRFYTGVLGFKIRARDRVLGSPQGALDLVYLDLGGTTIELISYPDAAPEPAPRAEHLGYRMMALEVEDMRKALDQLRANGIAPSWGPKTRERYARAEIRDPDGNSIELRQWL
jgi:catechol 2,3-dioxygenase-like lactoylglutathione lyase family enzyme